MHSGFYCVLLYFILLKWNKQWVTESLSKLIFKDGQWGHKGNGTVIVQSATEIPELLVPLMVNPQYCVSSSLSIFNLQGPRVSHCDISVPLAVCMHSPVVLPQHHLKLALHIFSSTLLPTVLSSPETGCEMCCCFPKWILQWSLKQKSAACWGDTPFSLAFCMHHIIFSSHSPNLINSDHWNRGDLFLGLSQISIFLNCSGFGIAWNSPDTCIVVVAVLTLMVFLLSSCCVQAAWHNCDLKGHLLREGNWDARHTFDNKKL